MRTKSLFVFFLWLCFIGVSFYLLDLYGIEQLFETREAKSLKLAKTTSGFDVNRQRKEQHKRRRECELPRCKPFNLKQFPLHILPKDIPQIVYIAIDDALTPTYSTLYQKLFWRWKNPNGCPISGSLYLIDYGTDYKCVSQFYDAGWEIGVHGLNHESYTDPRKLKYDAREQLRNLVTKAAVPRADIKGWRSPYLRTLGDEQIKVLKDLGYTYDISFTSSRDSWPFTLHQDWFDWSGPVLKSIGDFWIVPVQGTWKNRTDMCWDAFIDGCIRNFTAAGVTKYLLSNFRRHYYGKRQPFGIHTHGHLLYGNKAAMKGMMNFMKEITSLWDVYVLSVDKVLEWTKRPTKLSNIKSFRPWNC